MTTESSPSAFPTILVADDEDALRELVAEVIAEEGFRVLTASNGREAVEVFKNNIDEVQLIVLDMLMPEMDGRQAYHKLRELSKSVKILIATGFTNDEVVKGLVKEGANGVVDKPFHIEGLVDSIRAALNA